MTSSPNIAVYLRLIGVAALWGGTFIAGRIAAPELPHFTLAALRFGVAAAVLLPLLWRIEGGWPSLRGRDYAYTLALAVSGLVLYNLLFLGALARIPAGRTALVVALNPILTAVAMSVVFRERLALHRWAGIALALGGVWTVLSKGDPTAILQRLGAGETLMLGAAVCWAVYTIVGRYALAPPGAPSPLAVTAVTAVWGTLLLSVGIPFEWSDWQLANVSVASGLAIVYLGAGGTALAFVWYAEGLRKLGPARTAVFNNLVPVFGVFFGTWLLGETLIASMWVGGAIALVGVSLANWTPRS